MHEEAPEIDDYADAPTLPFAEERRDMLHHFDAYVARNTNPDQTIGRLTLRQTETFHNIRDFVAGDGRRDRHGLLELACGYGKSGLATMATEALGAGQLRTDQLQRQALVATSRLSIVRQLVEGNTHYVDEDQESLLSDFGYFAPNVATSVYSGRAKDLTGDAVVTPYVSFSNLMRKRPQTFRRFSALVFDECHNLGAGRMNELAALDPDALLLGLSATPEKSRELFTSVIDRVPMIDGILKYKFLSDITMHGKPTGYAFRPQYVGVEYSMIDIEKISQLGERNAQIVDIARQATLDYGPGIVKCHRQNYSGFNHLSAITELLNNDPPMITRGGKTRPMRTEAVAASVKESWDIIHEFKHGDSIDILTYVDIIGEGVNIPAMRWGLWTPPTKSFRALEQFIGRGLRLDSGDERKQFQFFQLMDIDLHDHLANAFGWELFDMPRYLREAEVTWTKGKKHDRGSPPNPEDFVIVDNTFAIEKPDVAQPVVALDGNTAEDVSDKELIAFDDIPLPTGVDPLWIKRVLVREGFTSYLRSVDGEPKILYDASAAKFIQDSFASDQDIIIARAARAFNVDVRRMRLILDEYKAELRYLFAPVATRHVTYQHVSASELQRIWDARYSRVEPVRPDEILLSDVVAMTGRAEYKLNTVFFQERGFTMDIRRTDLTLYMERPVMLRSEIVPWVTAYNNAPHFPGKQFYKSIASYSKQAFAEGDFEKRDAFIALKNLGITPLMFKHAHGRRFEYISRADEEAVTAEIGRVIAARLAATETGAYVPAPPRKPRKVKIPPLRIPRIAATDYAFALHNTTDQEDTASQDDSEEPQESFEQVRAAFETAHEDGSYIPSNVLRALVKRHPGLAADMLEANGRPKFDTFDAFKAVIDRSINAVPDVPPTWVYVGDIADRAGVDERLIMQLLADKKISASHARMGEYSGVKGLIAFCSPEFTQFLLMRFHKQAEIEGNN